jgi:septal ring factor EnvC (AmiA/AmiB activator)
MEFLQLLGIPIATVLLTLFVQKFFKNSEAGQENLITHSLREEMEKRFADVWRHFHNRNRETATTFDNHNGRLIKLETDHVYTTDSLSKMERELENLGKKIDGLLKAISRLASQGGKNE